MMIRKYEERTNFRENDNRMNAFIQNQKKKRMLNFLDQLMRKKKGLGNSILTEHIVKKRNGREAANKLAFVNG